MDRTKLLERIKKCLTMAENSRGDNSAEAAVALGMAQKLMTKYGVTDAEIGAVGFGNDCVRVPIQVNKKLPLVLVILVNLIKEAFGVEPVVEHEVRVSDKSYVIRWFGREDRVMLACYSQTVVHRAMNAAWAKHLSEKPYLRKERGARAGFQIGWLEAVRAQVEALALEEKEVAATELVKKNHYGRELTKTKRNDMKIDPYAQNAGAQAGADFKLHRPMTSDRLKIEK